MVDIKQPNISENARKFTEKLSYILNLGTQEGKSITEVSAEYNRKKASRDEIIYRLAVIGWNQQEIAEVVGIERSNVSRNVQKFTDKVSHILDLGTQEGKSIAELSRCLKLSQWKRFYLGFTGFSVATRCRIRNRFIWGLLDSLGGFLISQTLTTFQGNES